MFLTITNLHENRGGLVFQTIASNIYTDVPASLHWTKLLSFVATDKNIAAATIYLRLAIYCNLQLKIQRR